MEVMFMELQVRKGKWSLNAAISKAVGNTLFKKRASHKVAYEPGPPKTGGLLFGKERTKEVFER